MLAVSASWGISQEWKRHLATEHDCFNPVVGNRRHRTRSYTRFIDSRPSLCRVPHRCSLMLERLNFL
jgi:hypothetical protein